MNGAHSAIRLAVAVPAIIALAACGEQRTPTDATTGVPDVAASRQLNGPKHAGAIVAHDDCEPNSFNEANGPGTCVKHGHTTFSAFVAELQATQVAQRWRFNPVQVMAQSGIDVLGNNVGGEEHSFTPVKQFGGGIIPILNQLSGNPVEAQECANLEDDDLVPSGGRYLIEAEELSNVADASGVAHVQCCIHPWMRSEVTIKSR